MDIHVFIGMREYGKVLKNQVSTVHITGCHLHINDKGTLTLLLSHNVNIWQVVVGLSLNINGNNNSQVYWQHLLNPNIVYRININDEWTTEVLVSSVEDLMCSYTLRALIDLYLIRNLIDYVKDIEFFKYTTRKRKKKKRRGRGIKRKKLLGTVLIQIFWLSSLCSQNSDCSFN